MSTKATATGAPLESWRRLFDETVASLPGDAAQRRRQLERFMATGFPPKKGVEHWRYTDVTALARTAYAVAQRDKAPSFRRLPDTDYLVFVNGHGVEGDAARHGLREVADSEHGNIVALNAAFASDGLRLELAPGKRLERPLYVVDYRSGEAPSTSHLRHRITLGDNAEATVILDSRGDGHYFGTAVLEAKLGAGAHLHLYRIQEAAAGATDLATSFVSVGRDAAFEAYSFDLGSGLARHDFNVTLAAHGADVKVHALTVADQRTHVDNQVKVEHAAPHGRSRIDFRGIAGGRAKVIFDGLILVDRGATKTDSDQRIANLLLSSRAEVNAKPELEIYNDDVRCDHGAATGQLDPVQLFYLRSRGIDEMTARELLTLAFVSTVLETVPNEPLREMLRERVGQRLQAALAAEAPAEASA
ncbi:MAG TPA: Fe-S cluster assembly protein SufD [Nevskiaceae bacterium]